MTAGQNDRAKNTNRNARRPTDLDLRIGALIREQRLLQNLAQDQLARAVGVTQHQLQKYETGENRIAASRLVECAQALKVPVAWFYHSIGTPRQTVASSGELTSEERALLDVFRRLDPQRQKQLIDIASVIGVPASAVQLRKRSPRRP
jgi:transcriptional regulator with XRE-family HTH domain